MLLHVNKRLYWLAREKRSDLLANCKNVDDSLMLVALKLGEEEMSECSEV